MYLCGMKYKYVKSKYRSPWKGIILEQIRRKKSNDLCLCLITNDKSGNKPNKRYLKILDIAWLDEIKPFDISHVPEQWFIVPPERSLSSYKGYLQ